MDNVYRFILRNVLDTVSKSDNNLDIVKEIDLPNEYKEILRLTIEDIGNCETISRIMQERDRHLTRAKILEEKLKSLGIKEPSPWDGGRVGPVGEE